MQSKLSLERELRELLGTGRNAGIAARYYGFDGRGGGSLQTVGNEIGLSRERVRQIVTATSEWVRTRRPVSPTLDRTIAFVVDRIPAAAGEIEAELRSQRLTSGLFRLEGVVKAAELLNMVDTPRRLVVLEPDGVRYLKAGPEERKAIWREQLLKLRLFRDVRDALDRQPRHEIDRDFLLETIVLSMPHENFERTANTFIRWARFGDLFAYDEDTQTIALQ